MAASYVEYLVAIALLPSGGEMTLSSINTALGPAFLRGTMAEPCTDFQASLFVWWPSPLECWGNLHVQSEENGNLVLLCFRWFLFLAVLLKYWLGDNIFSRERLRRVLRKKHLPNYISSTSAHLHLHICKSTSSHLNIWARTSSHLQTYISAHFHICTSTSLLIFTSARLHLCSSSNLHIANAVAPTLALNFLGSLFYRGLQAVRMWGRANLRRHLLLAVLWGFANAVAPTLALNFSWFVILWVCKRLESEVARISVATCCSLCYGGLQTRLRRRLRWIFLGSLFFGFARGWKVRSHEFPSPLVARCAMGVWKRGCADACVEFFLARYFIGVCKQLDSEVARIYVATCCSLCYGGLQTRLRRRLRWIFLGSLFFGFARCWKVRSREFTFQPVAVARERNGKGEGGRKVEVTQLAEVD